MAGEQQFFLKRVATSWRSEFPFLKMVHLKEIPQIPKGCNFLCEDYFAVRSRYYFVQLDFSPKRRGHFSIGITISPDRTRSTLEAASVSQFSPVASGSYGVWQFMNKPRFEWALVDLEAEADALIGISSGLVKSPYVWRPTSYEQPLENIVSEAIKHVNQSLRMHVFPNLELHPNGLPAFPMHRDYPG